MEYYYFWLIVFAFTIYIFLTDKNVERFFLLLPSFLQFHYQKTKWWIVNNPRNPVVKWLIYRKSMKMAEKLMKEFEEKN